MRKAQAAFTIVEILIVIVVIAILAAISVVAYNGIQNRTHDVAVQQDLKNLKTKLESYNVINNGAYPDGSAASLSNATSGWRAAVSSYVISPAVAANLVYCYSTSDASIYAVVAKSKSGNSYYISSTNSVRPWAAAWSTAGVCADISSSYINNLRGYAPEDTTTGPWRAWTGVAN